MGDTITFLGTQAGNATATVGLNATVNFDTTSGGNGEAITITGDVTGATSSGAYAFTTLNNAVDNTAQTVVFNTATATEGLAGANVAASMVNVASATSLAQALDLAASLSAIAASSNPSVAGYATIATNTGVIDWFQYAGNTYVVEAINATGTAAAHTALMASDVVVKITGLVNIGANGAFAANTLTL